ncbi:hypothetical protein JCM10449v2_004037 [Rhodotorula kratochvilovae]
MAPSPLPALASLPSGFLALTLETAGSPAPWTTAPPVAPLDPRELVGALVTLARALSDAGEQRAILAQALERAQQAHDEQRRTVARAKDAVLHASRAAQLAHGEARRVEKMNGVFRTGADRAVASLDRKVLRLMRGGRRAHEALSDEGRRRGQAGEDPLAPYAFVEELVVDLELDEVDVVKGSRGAVLDAEWQAIEDDLVATLAARVIEKASPRIASTFRLPRLDGADDGDDAAPLRPMSLPPTPPGSVHSSDLGEADDPDAEDDDDEAPDEDALAALLRPVVHPVIALLFHLHHLLGARLTAAVDTFESLVRASSAAVDAHRLAAQRLSKSTAKLRDLRALEERERDEEERVADELRDTVVALAKLRNGVQEG